MPRLGMIFDSPHYIQSDGFNIATYATGPEDGPPLILVHGWPELAYSWSNQMQPLAERGYRVIAYDLKGFGRSDAPHGDSHYSIAQLVADLEAVMNGHGIPQCPIIGHDWGGIIVWQAARMISERVTGVVSVCTPHVSPAPINPVSIFKARYGDGHYFVHFNEKPGVAAKLFAQNPTAFFNMLSRSTPRGYKMPKDFAHFPDKFEAYLKAGAPDMPGLVMPESARAFYAESYARSGFHGGISLYRNTEANWELTRDLSMTVAQPSLMISPRDDIILPPETTNHMPDVIPDLERVIIDDCGHWAMWDNPTALNAALLSWLDRRFPAA